MIASPQPENLFLSKLSKKVYEHIEPRLETVEIPLGTVLYKQYEPITHIYFPENSVISIVTVLENGASVETGIIGREGFAGIDAILSDNISSREATSQLSGKCLRIEINEFRTAFDDNDELRRFALRYIQAFIAQISQNSACLLLHRIENRLARWLLMMLDRAQEDEIYLTQEFIALMLGVHRPTVSKIANELQQKGLIRYSRGHITLIDRSGLQQTACECYMVIDKAVDRYLEIPG